MLLFKSLPVNNLRLDTIIWYSLCILLGVDNAEKNPLVDHPKKFDFSGKLQQRKYLFVPIMRGSEISAKEPFDFNCLLTIYKRRTNHESYVLAK